MCAIAGFYHCGYDYLKEAGIWHQTLLKMAELQKHRGPDDSGIFLGSRVGLSHARLSILDLDKGTQPMRLKAADGHMGAIVFNGEIYNSPSLRESLIREGASFFSSSDTEVLLMGYLMHGVDYFQELNGIFAFAIWDETCEKLILVRDRMGVKPLFYTNQNGHLVFASELKALFAFPGIRAQVDREGLCEIFGLGPAKTPGKGVFKDCCELRPGYFMEIDHSGMHSRCYWELVSKPHEDTWDQTIEYTRYLVTDSVKLQLLSDVPVCTFLSGGIDSSLVTAICSSEFKKQSCTLDTYSFDFESNAQNFRANAFQPSQDRPYVDLMAQYCGTNHHYLECTSDSLLSYLYHAVDARDLPCMADVEASMLYFCELVSMNHKVALTGECADEIFGGYPWFHKKECFEADTFPWSMDFTPRTALLREEITELLPLREYVQDAYRKTLAEVPLLPEETPEEKRRREISYLNLKWFMQTLLDRMDRTAMHTGLEARVPFSDHRIVEYLWNVPWEMKCHNGVVKGLLRESAADLLPKEILYRRKSPYPKTYDPAYERLLGKELLRILSDSNHPLCLLVDPAKVQRFLEIPGDYGKPFFGQLMAGPQLLAYLIQVGYWLESYKINLLF